MASVVDLIVALNQESDSAARRDIINSIPGLDPGQNLFLTNIALHGSAEAGLEVGDVVTDADLAGWAAPPMQFPQTPGVPAGDGGLTFPDAGGGVSTAALDFGNLLGSSGGGYDVAFGFPLLERTFDMILRANADRRATIDQNVQILGTLADLERVSPTRAASVAAGLGLPEPQFDFLSVLSQPGPAFSPSATPFGGLVGSQNVMLPGALSGQQLSGLLDNENVARIVMDVAERFGRPDLLSTSAQGLLPTSGLLTSIA